MALNGEPMMAARDQNFANQKCHLLGSNQGPSDLQSDALPTELKRLLVVDKRVAKGGFDPPTFGL